MTNAFDMTPVSVDATLCERSGMGVMVECAGIRGWVNASFGVSPQDREMLRAGPLGVPMRLSLPAFVVVNNGWRTGK